MAEWPWPAPVDDGGASHLVPGVAMPDIALASTAGGRVSLARAGGRTVAFIYPWTGRPGFDNPAGWDGIAGAHGSTPQAEGFRDLFEAYRARGIGIVGISGQDGAWQQELRDRLGLPYPLLSDYDGALAAALGLPTFEAGGVSYLRRLTLVVDCGVIAGVFYPVHPPDSHAADLLAMLTAPAGRP